MDPAGSVRGWNSKTWKHADWGFSIWNFNGLNIINQSNSTGEIFYLYMYHLDQQRHKLRLSISGKGSELTFTCYTVPLK
jgi:hypothetical protein